MRRTPRQALARRQSCDEGSSLSGRGSSSASVIDCLNSRSPFPSWRPISGTRLGPNTSKTTTSSRTISGMLTKLPIARG